MIERVKGGIQLFSNGLKGVGLVDEDNHNNTIISVVGASLEVPDDAGDSIRLPKN